jgi:C1A family cysteine protease
VAAAISASSSIFRFYGKGIIDDEMIVGQDHMLCGGEINHAVTIVGLGVDPVTEKQYFIVKNSFGSDWGENGYARIAATNNAKKPLGSCSILA